MDPAAPCVPVLHNAYQVTVWVPSLSPVTISGMGSCVPGYVPEEPYHRSPPLLLLPFPHRTGPPPSIHCTALMVLVLTPPQCPCSHPARYSCGLTASWQWLPIKFKANSRDVVPPGMLTAAVSLSVRAPCTPSTPSPSFLLSPSSLPRHPPPYFNPHRLLMHCTPPTHYTCTGHAMGPSPPRGGTGGVGAGVGERGA